MPATIRELLEAKGYNTDYCKERIYSDYVLESLKAPYKKLYDYAREDLYWTHEIYLHSKYGKFGGRTNE